MTNRPQNRTRWVAYTLFAAAQFSAALFNGGVGSQEWVWIAFVVSAAALLAAISRQRRFQQGRPALELVLLAALTVWLFMQWIPLPPQVVQLLSPSRWQAAQNARVVAGGALDSFLSLSVAPAATLFRLLCVLPAMAAFLTAREAAQWWNGRAIWLLAAPLILVGLGESALGMVQSALASDAAHGTYVNRDHFAGLLEMALPLAVAWAISLQIRECTHHGRAFSNSLRTLGTVALAAVAATMIRALVLSLSRMGFLDSLVALTLVGTALLAVLRKRQDFAIPLWLLPVPVVAVLALAIFTSTTELLQRFTDIALSTQAPSTQAPQSDTAADRVADEFSGDRLDMWRGTLRMVRHYPVTGVGLGAYQHAFPLYQNFLPGFTIDFAHNDYLQILAEIGWVGALLVFGLISVIVFRLTVALWRPHPDHWPLALGLLGGLTAIALHSVVDFNLYIPANALAVAWLAGLAVSPALQHPGIVHRKRSSAHAQNLLQISPPLGPLAPVARSQRAGGVE